MSISPEVNSRIEAQVSAMNTYERAARAAELIDATDPSEEDELEFAKLVCGPPD